MNKLIRFVFLIFVSAALIVLPYFCYSFYMLGHDRYKEKITWIIYYTISKGKQNAKKSKKIVFGDSVGNQLYYAETYNDSIFSLASNQAIGIVGQYMLFKNFVDHNDIKGKEIYLVCTPLTFKDNLNQNFTFNYFLKPFYTDIFRPELSDMAIKQIKKIPLYWASQFPIIKTSNWSTFPSASVNFEVEKEYYISDLSLEYLKRMQSLVDSCGAKLKIVSPFLNEKRKEFDPGRMKAQIEENNLRSVFGNYLEDLEYLPDSLFVDLNHYDRSKFEIIYNPLGI